ncbi:NUDIX hydrolase [Thecamonas trahens ATCC 50062]|uniref:NUDIX hydrolase n=1 Tax=Thecamonas trahens ATCC 50062 TaxID=461836 RepID=A0A0L0DVQ2_THETB|nr:NUDIX hydrolase [Thecamonas trahens ATCC 50062]KNC55593.1 NUDIX hydrolase [Thecamonas trahens ATCC 50062]|eukprot:XP_013761366.1 NUDIX hydrolase [Thecamonas trahens ATCC 50062]
MSATKTCNIVACIVAVGESGASAAAGKVKRAVEVIDGAWAGECCAVGAAAEAVAAACAAAADAGAAGALVVAMADASETSVQSVLQILVHVKRTEPGWLRVVWSEEGSESAEIRLALCRGGAAMVTASATALDEALTLAGGDAAARSEDQGVACPFCGVNGFDELGLWAHVPLFHMVERNEVSGSRCPLCPRKRLDDPFPVHLFTKHYPPHLPPHEENAQPGLLYAFALVVVVRPVDGAILVVQEFDDQGFWLPGGRVDPGEGLAAAAVRETREEAGIDVRLTGILRMEFFPRPRYVRQRIVFLAEVEDPNQRPKTVPDFQSAGAAWATLDELRQVSLRGSEPLVWATYLSRGGRASPLSLLHEAGGGLPPGVTNDDIASYKTRR